MSEPIYSAAAHRYMGREMAKGVMDVFFCQQGDTARTRMTFLGWLALAQGLAFFKATHLFVLFLLVDTFQFICHCSQLENQKIELMSDIHCKETDLTCEWAKEPW